MFRKLAIGGALVASLASARAAVAADEAERVLAGKGLHLSVATYVLKAEDDVKKAADAAEARLKELRRVVYSEKNASRTEEEKKALLADLTKQRATLKQQMDQTLPQIRAQMQILTQQQNALSLEMSGSRLGNNRFQRLPSNQTAYEAGGLANQIGMLQMQGEQLVNEFNDLNYQIEQLKPNPGAGAEPPKTKPGEKPKTSPAVQEKLKAYVDAVAALRKLVDETKKQYSTLAEDPKVKAAVDSLNKPSARLKYELGPSKKFQDTVASLEQAEAKIAAKTLTDDPRPTVASPKRKSKVARRK
jgi:hypothetical protein